MSFMEEIQKFHLKMQQEDLTIPTPIWENIKVIKHHHKAIMNNAKESAHKHAFWCSDFFMEMPISMGVLSHMIFSHFASKYSVPITWFYMIPHNIVIDPAYQKVIVLDEPEWFNADGSANTVMKAAFLDGIDSGLVDKDEEFVFADSDEATSFVEHTTGSIKKYAEANGMSFEQAVANLTGENLDMSFPHGSDEDDDSLQ